MQHFKRRVSTLVDVAKAGVDASRNEKESTFSENLIEYLKSKNVKGEIVSVLGSIENKRKRF